MLKNEPEKTLLPLNYYLVNFETLLAFVFDRYAGILNQEDRDFYHQYVTLTEPARMLYVRLINRKGPLFRLDKLHYPEIPSLPEAAIELSDKGFIGTHGMLSTTDHLVLLTRKELMSLLPGKKENNRSISKFSKHDLIVYIIERYKDSIKSLLKNYPFVFPAHREKVNLYLLLFFGNTHQTLSDFILEDIGALKYEKYALSGINEVFSSRDIAEKRLELSITGKLLYESILAGDASSIVEIAGSLLEDSVTEPVLHKTRKLLAEAGRALEHLGNGELALACYRSSGMPPARERMARILAARGDHKEAKSILEEMRKNPLSPEEAEFSSNFDVQKARIRPKRGRSRENIFREHPMSLKSPSGNLSIEEKALSEVCRVRGVHGFYIENRLWTALFGLAFWDIVFMEGPGRFFHPFQRGPADLFDPGFRTSREHEIAERLTEISTTKNLSGWLTSVYRKKQHTANFLVNWKKISEEQVGSVCDALPGHDLACILERMSRNLRNYTSGFPDLFVFTTESPGYLLIEVKGPGDQLRPNQKSWMRYFVEQGIPFEILRIQTIPKQ